jgi:6-phosphogluconolactonase
MFLVSGAKKGEALRRLLDPAESPQRTPAKLAQTEAEIIVLADEAACEGL